MTQPVFIKARAVDPNFDGEIGAEECWINVIYVTQIYPMPTGDWIIHFIGQHQDQDTGDTPVVFYVNPKHAKAVFTLQGAPA